MFRTYVKNPNEREENVWIPHSFTYSYVQILKYNHILSIILDLESSNLSLFLN